MWKRFYDLLIKAQKLVSQGKLAFILSEDGDEIILTSEVYADDTLLPAGDNANLKARCRMQQDFIDYSGSNVKPTKCILTATATSSHLPPPTSHLPPLCCEPGPTYHL